MTVAELVVMLMEHDLESPVFIAQAHDPGLSSQVDATRADVWDPGHGLPANAVVLS